MTPKLRMETKIMEKNLQKLARQSPTNFEEAMKVGAIQFLTWANTGTGKSSKKPPILRGILRGSSSAFVNKKLVSIFKPHMMSGQATPAKSNPMGKALRMLWVWNTAYATRMHEWKGGWGKMTKQDNDAGNQWLTENLKENRFDLMKLIAVEHKKRLN